MLDLSAIDLDPIVTALAVAEQLPERVGRTEPMSIEIFPVYQTAQKWQADH